MTADSLHQVLTRHLFSDLNSHVYTVLDGAAIPDLFDKFREFEIEAICLYRGELEPELAKTAPYQVTLERDSPFTKWLLQGWGQHWGFFVISNASWRAMREHLRSLTIVYDPDHQPMYFRYYDPRVLRLYLPTCNAEELRIVFGPASRFILEAEDSTNLLRFWVSSGELGHDQIALQPNSNQAGE